MKFHLVSAHFALKHGEHDRALVSLFAALAYCPARNSDWAYVMRAIRFTRIARDQINA